MNRRSLFRASASLIGSIVPSYALRSEPEPIAPVDQGTTTFSDQRTAASSFVGENIRHIELQGLQYAGDGLGGTWTDDPLRGDGDGFWTSKPTERFWSRKSGDYQDPLTDAVKRSVAVPRKMKILMLSDIQPSTLEGVKSWRARLNGLRRRHQDVDFVCILGDLVNRGEPYRDPKSHGDMRVEDQYLYADLLNDLDGFPPNDDRLVVINGNHDRSYLGETVGKGGRRFDEYLRHFPRQFFYMKIGNIVLIFIGNITQHTQQPLPHFLVEWLESVVRENQDSIIILSTHEPLHDTTNKTISGRYPPLLYPPKRLVEMLTNPGMRIDIWPSGHIGGDYRPGREVGWIEKYNTFHLQVGANLGMPRTQEFQASYVLLELEQGSTTARFTRWDADDGVIIDRYEHHMRRKAHLSNQVTYDGRYQSDPRHDVQLFPEKRYSNVPRSWASGRWAPSDRISWMQTLGLLDVSGDDMPEGVGLGVRFDLPGAQTNDLSHPESYNGYGFGGGLSIERAGSRENDYTARFALAVNAGSGAGEEDLRRTIVSHVGGTLISVWSAAGDPHQFRFEPRGIAIDGAEASQLPETPSRLMTGNITSATSALASRANSFEPRKHVVFENPGGVVGSIVTNGPSTAYLTTSDRRLKCNYEPIANSLDRLRSLISYRGEFVNQPDLPFDYFIADEVMQVVPNAVHGKPNAMAEVGNHSQLHDVGELCVTSVEAPLGCSILETNVWHDDPRRLAGLPQGQFWRRTGQAYRIYRTGVASDGIEPPDRWEKTGSRPVYQAIDLSMLVPLLWAATRELLEENEKLKKRLRDVETAIEGSTKN